MLFNFLIALATFLFALSTWFLSPDLGRRISQISQARSWYLQIDTEPGQVSDRLSVLVPTLERLLRSESEISDLHIISQTDSVIAVFQTINRIDARNLAERMSSKLSAMSENRIFQMTGYRMFQQPRGSVSLSTGAKLPASIDTFPLEVARLTDLTKKEPSGFNIYRVARPDLTVQFDKKSTVDADVLNTILQQIQSIDGVQTSYIKNFRQPYARIRSDSRQMLQTGISPLRMRQTMQTHLTQTSGVSQTVFTQPSYIMEVKPESLAELCNVAIPNDRTGSIVRLCDISEIALEEVVVPYREVTSSENTLAKALMRQGATKQKSTTIEVLFTPEARARDIEREIRGVLAKHPKEKLPVWQIKLHNPAPLPLVEFISSIVLILTLGVLSLRSDALERDRRFHHIQILLAAILGTSLLMALRIPISTDDFTIFLVASLTFALASHFSQFVHKASTSIPFWIEFALFSAAVVLAVALSRFLAGATTSHGSTMTASIAIFLGQLVAFVSTQIGLGETAPKASDSIRELTTHRRGSSIWFLGGLSILALFLAPRSPNENALLSGRFGFDLGVQEEQLKAAFAEIENATTPGLAKGFLGGPLWNKTLEVKPTTFSLMNSTQINIRHILESMTPKELGTIEIQTRSGSLQTTPVIDVPPRVAVAGDSTAQTIAPQIIEEFQQWSNTIQWPITKPSGQGNDEAQRQLFLPLSTLMEARWENELTRSMRTTEGETIILNWIVNSSEAEKAKRAMERLAAKIRSSMGVKLRLALHDSRDARQAVAEANQLATLILTGLLLFAGILFFASSERGLIAGVTFLAINLGMTSSDRIYESLAEITGQPPLGAREFPSPVIWAGLYLFLVWATMLRVADYRRSTNMSLSSAFVPQIEVIRKLDAAIMKPLIVALAIAWWTPETRLAGGILLGLVLLFNQFLADWMLFWSHLSEIKNRAILRFRIHIRELTHLALLLAALGVVVEARAASDVSLVNAECQSTATVILPIVGRPKGKEPAPRRNIFQEKLAQETPCAWLDSSLESEIVTAVEETRGPSEQELLVTRLRDIVTKHRTVIESRVKAAISKRIKLSKILIYGGFYEEFFGNISFTIIDFRSDGDPVLTKMTFSVDNQTHGIAQLAEFLRGESIKFYEELLGEGERLPVYIERTESLDKHPVSENLAGEISLFLQSRFLYPVSFDWFERKTFFRLVKDRKDARYVLSVKIRREGTKFYATIMAEPPELGARRTAWIEGDISQLPLFEEDVLSTAKRSLSNIEGITDYCLAPHLDFLTDYDQTSRLYGFAFRQNLGNAAISLRLRTGEHRASGGRETDLYSVLDGGGGVGWQFFDKRWVVADAGVSVDAGLLSPNSKKSTLQVRSFFVSYGGYVQSQLSLRKNFALLTRVGLEQPILFAESTTAATIFSSYYTNLMVGLGVTF
jgi:hypothetical protein